MTWYYYLNYRIYRFYKRKRDSMPVFFSYAATTLLMFINIFILLAVVNFFIPFFQLGNKYYTIVLLALLAIFNYLVLYRGKYYQEVFSYFEKHKSRYESWEKSVPIYIISSILLLLIILAIADYRHDGHF